MIIISCYNPDTNRSTVDEHLLTSLLASLINYRSVSLSAINTPTGQENKTYYEAEAENALILIGQVFPLLGLTMAEILELLRQKGV